MKKRKTFLGLVLVIAVLVLGVGYAALANIEFAINGTATATSNSDNFVVTWDTFDMNEYDLDSDVPGKIKDVLDSKYIEVSEDGYDVQPIASILYDNEDKDHKAKISISGLSYVGESITFILPIVNKSDGIDAVLGEPNVTNTGSNASYFDVTATYGASSRLAPGAKGEIRVTVTLKKPVIDGDVSAVFGVDFNAVPTEAQ